MSKDEIRAEASSRLGEYFDGYIVIGKVAGRDEVVVNYNLTESPQDRLRIKLALFAMIQSPEFACVRTFIRNVKTVR